MDKKDSDLVVAFEPGEVVLQEGRSGSEMFVVESGEFELVKGFGPLERRIALLGPGDFFGELAVLDTAPYSFTARARTKGGLVPISTLTFDLLLRRHPEVTLRILRKMAQRLRKFEEEAQRAHAVAAGAFEGASPQLHAISVRNLGSSPPPRPPNMLPPPPQPPSVSPSVVQKQKQNLPEAQIQGRLIHVETEMAFPLLADRPSLLGRFDPISGHAPEIDLGTLDRQRSLSRRHASIALREGQWQVRQEIGVTNGTWINGRRLAPGEECLIHQGDKLRLGTVELVLDLTPAARRQS